MRRIILDTNFLFIPSYFGVDIFSEIQRICAFGYSLNILDKTHDELERVIEEARGARRDAARFARVLLNRYHIESIDTTGYTGDVDARLVNICTPESDIVATQDKELRRKLKSKGVGMIVLRQKRYLQLLE